MGHFNLKQQFTFYAQYHNNAVNQWIHIACVWPILWSAIVMMYYSAAFCQLPENFASTPFGSLVKINIGIVAASVYIIYYPILGRKAGILGSILIAGSYLSANYFAIHTPDAFNIALSIHIACWIAQFIGHGVFEGRSPALVDNLAQALLMAPLFVLIEVLMRFGMYKSFLNDIQGDVDAAIAKWKMEKEAKKLAAVASSSNDKHKENDENNCLKFKIFQ